MHLNDRPAGAMLRLRELPVNVDAHEPSDLASAY
jgi:hypothetical protein